MNIEKDWFYNERSYKAFLYAVDLTLKLEALRVKGALIFDDGDLCSAKGKWRVKLDGEQSDVGFTHGNCTQLYAGCTHDCFSGKIWLSKKMVDKAFSDIAVVMPQHFKTIKDLK